MTWTRHKHGAGATPTFGRRRRRADQLWSAAAASAKWRRRRRRTALLWTWAKINELTDQNLVCRWNHPFIVPLCSDYVSSAMVTYCGIFFLFLPIKDVILSILLKFYSTDWLLISCLLFYDPPYSGASAVRPQVKSTPFPFLPFALFLFVPQFLIFLPPILSFPLPSGLFPSPSHS